MTESSKREKSWQAGPLRIRVTLPDDQPSRPKERLTVERIVDTAMDLMAEKGYDAVSMRSLAKALDTGPASLYAHVASKEELDQHVLDRIAADLVLPEPDPDRWQDQLKDILRSMLQMFRTHPGSARAALGTIPTTTNVMRVSDGLLAIAIGGESRRRRPPGSVTSRRSTSARSPTRRRSGRPAPLPVSRSSTTRPSTPSSWR